MLRTIILFLSLAFATPALAEEGCPSGQIPAQAGRGVTSCGPIPQGYYQQNAPSRPSGKWIKTWGAIALGVIDTTPYYAVPTGLNSKAEAEAEALQRCRKIDAQGCVVKISYKNQCAAIGEPQTNGEPNPEGFVQFISQSTKDGAAKEALASCKARNPAMQCKVIFSACSEPIFEKF
ncbi:DUF4189 domain-containing protein [Xanthomonas campestris pv. campestris]|nr:DUF4189 domain-containing protein [Xanthomonas campestris pv. campestris]